MKNQIAEQLIQKYLEGKCTPEEKAMLFSWYNDRSNALKDSMEEPDYPSLNLEISKGLPPAPVRRGKLWPKIAAAASVVFAVTAAVLFYNRPQAPAEVPAAYTTDLAPGGNAATLTLPNGQKISLTDIGKGQRVVRSGVEVYKNNEGQLVYKAIEDKSSPDQAGRYNTIETPKGGQYQIVLPDGTLVFLNAASTLRFPRVFPASGREVELTGEAFFDVAKVKSGKGSLPFLVTAGNTRIEVLGTQFNVMAYLNEAGQETTLLEGAVQVSRIAGKLKAGDTGERRILKPGEQARISPAQQGIEVLENLNTDAVIGWKSGIFVFDRTPLQKVMQQVSRWYDAEVVYVGKIPNISFNGVIPRSSYASEVLKVLQLAGSLNFTIEGKTIRVKNKSL